MTLWPCFQHVTTVVQKTFVPFVTHVAAGALRDDAVHDQRANVLLGLVIGAPLKIPKMIEECLFLLHYPKFRNVLRICKKSKKYFLPSWVF